MSEVSEEYNISEVQKKVWEIKEKNKQQLLASKMDFSRRRCKKKTYTTREIIKVDMIDEIQKMQLIWIRNQD